MSHPSMLIRMLTKLEGERQHYIAEEVLRGWQFSPQFELEADHIGYTTSSSSFFSLPILISYSHFFCCDFCCDFFFLFIFFIFLLLFILISTPFIFISFLHIIFSLTIIFISYHLHIIFI